MRKFLNIPIVLVTAWAAFAGVMVFSSFFALGQSSGVPTPIPLPVARGGTNCTSASITCVNNIFGATAAITIAGASVSLGGSYAPARAFTSPAAPTGNSTSTYLMVGYGATITPATSGKIAIQFSGSASNNTINDGCVWQMEYGTGSAPANGASTPPTGYISTIGQNYAMQDGVTGGNVPWTATGYLSGLSVSTTYWVDLEFKNLTGGTCNMGAANILITEQ